MKQQPRIHPAAIDLLSRYYNSHKKGLPEWLKNAREAYLRNPAIVGEDRRIIVHHVPKRRGTAEMLECIDFVGVSNGAIHEKYIEWANPKAASLGLKPGEAEGGQGNGGKAYLREMFEEGYFVSIKAGELSVVSFDDPEKYILDFLPNEGRDNPQTKHIREYAEGWLKAFDLPKDHGITIVRGIKPRKVIDADRLIVDILQFPHARETINSCVVDFYVDRIHSRTLKVSTPDLHPYFAKPVVVKVPPVIETEDGVKVSTMRGPEFLQGSVELCMAAAPLQGAMASWNRIEFRAGGVSVVGFKKADELPLEHGGFSRHLFGKCDVPLLKDPKDNYEMQGRGELNEGPLSVALYRFIATEGDKLLGQMAKQTAGATAQKKRKNLEKLHKRLSDWIGEKLTTLAGLSESGLGDGKGKRKRKTPRVVPHQPAVRLAIHRTNIDICSGVSYPLRALAFDAEQKPVPPGKVMWRSSDSKIAFVHPEYGVVEGRGEGLATISASSLDGLVAVPALVAVHQAADLAIKGSSPLKVGCNRRLPLTVTVKKKDGKQAPKDTVVSWAAADERIATVGPDGNLIGGEVGETFVTASAGGIASAPLAVSVEHGAAGKPRAGGKGQPQVLLSGQDTCPWNAPSSHLDPHDPPVYQRLGTPDYDNNVFWINLQHPLAEGLMDRFGEASVQWRIYHAQRMVDVYTILALRSQYGDEETDVNSVIEEMLMKAATILQDLREEIFDVVFDENLDIAHLGDKED